METFILTNFHISSLWAIFVCLILSAFFSSAETAITSLGAMKVKHMLNTRGKSVRQLRLWAVHPGRVLTTILIFNSVVNILGASLATVIAADFFQDQAVGVATGVVTFLVLVFGEIMPKSFAKTHAETWAIFSMRIVNLAYYSIYPVVLALSGFAEWVIKVFSKGAKRSPLITEDELEFIVNESQKAGVIEHIKKEIIEGAFDFDETRVREIMTPRTDLAAIEETDPINSLMELIIKSGHSRIPVYRETIDHVVGVVLAKDFLSLALNKAKQASVVYAKDLMRAPFFVPESKTIMEVFNDLKRSKSHIAIVIDEYGGTAGIVTMEDILEEIVGEIQDEFDAEEADIVQVDDKVHDVSGSINIDEFLDFFQLGSKELPEDEPTEQSDTLAGWMTQLISEMPEVGQKVTIGEFEMEVTEVDRHRIERVRITKVSPNLDSTEVTSPQYVDLG
jgi:CBS domain containing-hemolysin-like protein